MVGHDGLKEADRYGLWPWAVGALLSLGIMVAMFYLSRGFY
jgi:hypothetical protein